MRKLFLLGLFVSGAVHAGAVTHTCNSYTLYQGTGNGSYKVLNDSNDSANRFTITVTEPVIEVQVNNTDLPVVQFWKDYNVYRNNDGTIEQNGTDFTMKTAVPQGGVYIPVKIVYHCN